MVMVLQQCVTRLGAVEAATENRALGGFNAAKAMAQAAAGAPAQPNQGGSVPQNNPPPLRRQQSKSKQIFRTDDNQDVFFNVMDDVQPQDQKQMKIPPLLRQFSQEYASSNGDYPLLETGHGILPPRIASNDLNLFLVGSMPNAATAAAQPAQAPPPVPRRNSSLGFSQILGAAQATENGAANK
jgi:hypothetical protein